MGEEVYRKCGNCGMVNLNTDYCEQCGELINIGLKRELERERRKAKKRLKEKESKPNRVTLFFEKAGQHSNPFIRYTFKFFYSIWVIVMAIGSFLAFLVGYIAA